MQTWRHRRNLPPLRDHLHHPVVSQLEMGVLPLGVQSYHPVVVGRERQQGGVRWQERERESGAIVCAKKLVAAL
jgi:hypothetical protein